MNIKEIKRNPRAAAEGMTLGELRKTLQHFDYEYHDQNASSVSDQVYDILRDVHDERAKKPYARVGSKPTAAARRVKLPVSMGSLSKLKPGSSGLSAFLEKGPFVVSDKEDGISLQLVYKNHDLVAAYQRGDGTTGTDSSGVIPSLKVPHRIKAKELIVRVEFTMSRMIFDKYFNKATSKDGEYDNARNGAGGILNRNKPNPLIGKIKCIAHEIMQGTNARVAPSKQFAYLKSLGFDVVPHKVYTKLNDTILSNLLKIRKSRSQREMDGIVVAQDRPYTVSGKYPTHAFAFKINDLESSVLVKVKEVEWNESRHGQWVPRVIIEPTRIGGVTVQHFTGHNGFFIEHGYSSKVKTPPYAPRPINKGAEIRAVRSGDVIPYIVEVTKAAKYPAEPSVEYETDGVRYYTIHDESHDRLAKTLTNFFSTLEVDGIKRGTIDILVAAGYDTIKKIIDAKAKDFEQIERFGHTKAVTLERNIRNALAKNASLAKLGAGSGIFGDKFGVRRLEELFKVHPEIVYDKLPQAALVTKIQEVRGFKQLAVPLAKEMPKFRMFLKKLGIKPVAAKKVVAQSAKLAGVSVLFTSVRDKALADWIVANGGKLASTAKSANLLIVKDAFASNNKTEYARANGIPVLTLDQFRTKYKVS